MKTLIFDIFGRMAHFRRFYSSVTSLSYYFPPRNTVIGLIAAILGYDRDSYYKILGRENLGIAVSINNRYGLRRLVMNTNYLDTDNISLKRFRGEGKKPTTIEYILPMPPEQEVSYRIYTIPLRQELNYIIDELATRIERRKYVYPISLGPANCLAYAELVSSSADIEILKIEDKVSLPLTTVVPYSIIPEDGLMFDTGKKIILEDRLPPDFAEERKIDGGSSSRSYLFEMYGEAINLNLDSRASGNIFRTSIEGRDVYGAFM